MANTYHTYRVLTFCSNNTEKSDKRNGNLNNTEEKKETKGNFESENNTHADKDEGGKKVKDTHYIFTLEKGDSNQYKALASTSRVAKEAKQHITKDYNLRHIDNCSKIIAKQPKKAIPKENELFVGKNLSEIILQQPQKRKKNDKGNRSKNKLIIKESVPDIVKNDSGKEKKVRKIKPPRKKISFKDAKNFFMRYQSEGRNDNSKKQFVDMIYQTQNVDYDKAWLDDYNNHGNKKAKHKTAKDEQQNPKSHDVSKRVDDFYFSCSNEAGNILRLQTKTKPKKEGHKKRKTTNKQKKTRNIRLFKVSSQLPVVKRKKTRAKIINLDYFRRKLSFHVNSSSFNGKKVSKETNAKLKNHSKQKPKQNLNDDLQIIFSRQASKNLRSTEKNFNLDKCHSSSHSKDLFGFRKSNRSNPMEYWKCSTNTSFNPNLNPNERKCRSLEQNFLNNQQCMTCFAKKVKQLRDKCRNALPVHIYVPKCNEAASKLRPRPCDEVTQPKPPCDVMPTTYQDAPCDDRITVDLNQCAKCEPPPDPGPPSTCVPPPCEAPHPCSPSPCVPPPCDTRPCKQVPCDPLRTVEFPNGTGDNIEIYRVKPTAWKKPKRRPKKNETNKKCDTGCPAICSREVYCPEAGDAKVIDDQICCDSDDEESDDCDDEEVERRPSCDLKPESAFVITIRSCLVCMVMICWLPCILLVFMCWLITYPMRPHARKNEENKPLVKTFIEWIRTARWYNLSFLDVFWSMLHENCQDLENTSPKRSFSKTSVSGIIKRKISKQNLHQNTKTRKKRPCLKTPKAPQVPCQQMSPSSRLPPCPSPFPNKNRQYTLCHTTSRGWVMKPQREERMPPSILKKEGQSNRSQRVLNFKGVPCPPCPVRDMGTRAPIISRRCQAGMQGICIAQRVPAVAQLTNVPPRPSVTKVTCKCSAQSPTRGGTCSCTSTSPTLGGTCTCARPRSPICSQQFGICVPKPKPTCKCKVSRWKKCCRKCRNLCSEFTEFEKGTFDPNASCSEMYLSTMKNKPCFFLHDCCPQMYPFVLQMCSMYRNCCHMCLLMLSACIWIPWMLCCYLCVKVVCTCFN